MVELRESHRERELALLVDVSAAGNSSRACQMVEAFVEKLSEHPAGVLVDLNAGDLLLTRGVLSKIRQQIHRTGALLGTVYATVPQTQQAALDEGLYVKEKLMTDWTPVRQALPSAARPDQVDVSRSGAAGFDQSLSSQPSGRVGVRTGAVDLPDFNRSITRPPVEFAATPVRPEQAEDIPELPVAELDIVESVIVEEVVTGVITEKLPSDGEGGQAWADIPLEVDYPESAFETLYLRQTLRSGQTVRFNGNIVIIGDVHAGSEITAGGDIVVWGELRGIAHAGAQGNYKAEIRAMKIEALQLRIADYIARRPDRIYYHKEEAEASLSPEAARVADGEIKIFRTMLGNRS